MCRLIETNKISIPMYQRNSSWNQKKAVDLLNYQLLGKAPVSPLSMNKNGEVNGRDVKQLSFKDREEIAESPIGLLSVVDGQQRLTTNFKAYIDHKDFSRIVLDVRLGKFKIAGNILKDNEIPVGKLLNRDVSELTNCIETKEKVPGLFELLIQVRLKLQNYSYTIHTGDDLSELEQKKWFNVLNMAGNKVTRIQLDISQSKTSDFDIYKEYSEPFKEKLEKYGYGKFFTPFSTKESYPIASLNPAIEVIVNEGKHIGNYSPIPSDTKAKILKDLNKEQLELLCNTTLEGLEAALNIIQKHNIEIKRIETILYLTGFFVYRGEKWQRRTSEEKLVTFVKSFVFQNKTNSEKRALYTELITNY